MKKLILATKNAGKVDELKALLIHYDVEVLSLLDLGYEPEIEETGTTFEENALIKARTIAKEYGLLTIADDSGLEIDALDGKPGVYSAVYAGELKDDMANMNKVLSEMKNVPEAKRTARFRCTLVIVDEGGQEQLVHGTCEGLILNEGRGSNGHGYDPIFYVPEVGQTMAEMTGAEKNTLSHRKKAFDQLEQRMETLLIS